MNELEHHKFLSKVLEKTILTNNVIEKIITDYVIHSTEFHTNLIVFKTFGSMANTEEELIQECKDHFGIDDNFIEIHNQIHNQETDYYDGCYVTDEGPIWKLQIDTIDKLVWYRYNRIEYIMNPHSKVLYNNQCARVCRFGDKGHDTKGLDFPQYLIPPCVECKNKKDNMIWDCDPERKRRFSEIIYDWFCEECFTKLMTYGRYP